MKKYIFGLVTAIVAFSVIPGVAKAKSTILDESPKFTLVEEVLRLNLLLDKDEVDTDKDGLPDTLEDAIATSKYNKDTDNDGKSDFDELRDLENPRHYKAGEAVSPTTLNATVQWASVALQEALRAEKDFYRFADLAKTHHDNDYDGLPASLEKKLGTNPNKRDSDGDGYDDGVEVNFSYNPVLGDGAKMTLHQEDLADSFFEDITKEVLNIFFKEFGQDLEKAIEKQKDRLITSLKGVTDERCHSYISEIVDKNTLFTANLDIWYSNWRNTCLYSNVNIAVLSKNYRYTVKDAKTHKEVLKKTFKINSYEDSQIMQEEIDFYRTILQ